MIDENTKPGDFVILLEAYGTNLELKVGDVIKLESINESIKIYNDDSEYFIANLKSKVTNYGIYWKRIRKATIPEIVKAKLLGKFHE